MATIDWDNVQQEAGGDFKQYANPGTYKVKCIGCEIKEVGTNGSIIQKFIFEEDDVKYPTADHWLSFKNDNWRMWHQKCLMELLGAPEDKAKKTVEIAEAKGDKDFAVKAYQKAFDTLLAKKPSVDIEVYEDGKYSRSEFVDASVAMPHSNTSSSSAVDEVLPGAEEVDGEVDLSNLPF